jgi:DNA polymerase III subunit epsilon
MLVHASSEASTATFSGLSSRPRDALLVSRARDYLTAGPATAQQLIAAVCHLPGVPAAVAEHMAATLLAEVPGIRRDSSGLWGFHPLSRADDRPAARLDALSYAVVDLETTGGRPLNGDRITEIAAVIVQRGEIVDVFETLVNPRRVIPPWITRLTRISWGMVKDAPPFDALCDKVLAVLGGHVFVAHNARFDWSFLNAELERATGRTLQGPRLCTVRLARMLLPQLRRRSLDYLAMHYGVEIQNRHRARGDAIATAQVLIRLLAAARELGCATWQDLDELLLTATRRPRRSRRRAATPQPVTRDTTA